MAIVAKDILDTIMGHVEKLATTETIMGEPMTVGDKTIIPVMKVMVGFGAGGGEGEAPGKEGKKACAGSGGGGGGGLAISPAGFIVIDGDKISIHGPKPKAFESLFDTVFESVPDMVEKIVDIAGKKKEEKEEKK